MYKLFLSAALSLTALAAHAQVSLGIRAGVNLANIRQDLDNSSAEVDTKALVAPAGGLTLNARFGNLALQPSLLFAQKGYRIDDEDRVTINGVTLSQRRQETTRLNYLEVPINLVYTLNGEEGLQLYAGPYLAFGVGGRAKGEYSASGGSNSFSTKGEVGVKFADQDKSNDERVYFRPFDAGLNAGLGYKAGPLQAQLGYGLGLSNMLPDDPRGNEPAGSFRHGVVQFNLTYFLSGK